MLVPPQPPNSSISRIARAVQYPCGPAQWEGLCLIFFVLASPPPPRTPPPQSKVTVVEHNGIYNRDTLIG